MDDDVLDEVVAVLEAGGTVVLPTDTVYGIVALPGDPAAIARLFALKGRAESVPLAVLCATAEQALALVAPDPAPEILAVAARWWPGPLTLVLARRADIGLHLGQPAGTVGVRVPDHALVQAVTARVGPIAATSANRHGEPTPATAAEAAAALLDRVDVVVDGGRLEGRASTVLDATGWPWVVRRQGAARAEPIVATAAAARVVQLVLRLMPSRSRGAKGTVDDLRHIALFTRMSEAELARVADLGEPVDAEPGAIVIDQGDVGVECFLVLDGEAGILAAGQHVATIGKGAVVGEMALIGHKPRNATVTAQTSMRLLAFDISSFKKLLDEMPVAKKHIYELLEARARKNSGERDD